MSASPSRAPSNSRAEGNPAKGHRFRGRVTQPSHNYDRLRVIVRYGGELLVDLVITLPAPPTWPDDEQGIGGGR
jgi:hypothetical protein